MCTTTNHYSIAASCFVWYVRSSLSNDCMLAKMISHAGSSPAFVCNLWAASFSGIEGSRPGHCLGKILVDCAYCLPRKLSCDIAALPRMSPAQVTWQLWNRHCSQARLVLSITSLDVTCCTWRQKHSLHTNKLVINYRYTCMDYWHFIPICV